MCLCRILKGHFSNVTAKLCVSTVIPVFRVRSPERASDSDIFCLAKQALIIISLLKLIKGLPYKDHRKKGVQKLFFYVEWVF